MHEQTCMRLVQRRQRLLRRARQGDVGATGQGVSHRLVDRGPGKPLPFLQPPDGRRGGVADSATHTVVRRKKGANWIVRRAWRKARARRAGCVPRMASLALLGTKTDAMRQRRAAVPVIRNRGLHYHAEFISQRTLRWLHATRTPLGQQHSPNLPAGARWSPGVAAASVLRSHGRLRNAARTYAFTTAAVQRRPLRRPMRWSVAGCRRARSAPT